MGPDFPKGQINSDWERGPAGGQGGGGNGKGRGKGRAIANLLSEG